MKNVKNDTRYIIKRILIGVGIAIILFNLKKCNVYADSIQYRTFCNNNNNATSTWTYYNESRNCSNQNYNNSNETFTYNGYEYNIGWYASSNSTKPLLLVFEYNGEPYVTYGNIGTIPTGDNWYINITANQNQNNIKIKKTGESNISFTTGQLPYFSHSYIPGDATLNGGIVYTNVNTDNNINFQNATQLSWSFFLEHYEDLHMIYNTYNLPVYVNSDYEVPNVPDDPLANYTKVDLTGFQAVLLVPKNYQTMLSDSSHTNESAPGVFRTYLDLEYYSQECVRGSLINIENVQQVMLNNIGVGTGNLAESITGTCYAEPTQTIMSYEFDQYSGLIPRALLVYNGSYDWQSGFNNDTSYFGTSYVWYDPTMYNAYLVESFDNFNQTIQYKDYSGQDQEVTIESLPTFTESMENAIDNVDSPTPTEVNRQKLQAIFNFLKSPFTFINKLNTTSCSPIVFPLPFVNRNLTLECMSTAVYNRYLPTILKTFIITILNGLIFYRCTLNNIDIFTNILDPEDNKLEAIDL